MLMDLMTFALSENRWRAIALTPYPDAPIRVQSSHGDPPGFPRSGRGRAYRSSWCRSPPSSAGSSVVPIGACQFIITSAQSAGRAARSLLSDRRNRKGDAGGADGIAGWAEFRAALRADPGAIDHPLHGCRESWTGLCDLYRVGSHDRCLWAGPTGTRRGTGQYPAPIDRLSGDTRRLRRLIRFAKHNGYWSDCAG